MTKEQIIERAKKIDSGEYTGTKLYPVNPGRETAIKYLKRRKIDPKEVFSDYTEDTTHKETPKEDTRQMKDTQEKNTQEKNTQEKNTQEKDVMNGILSLIQQQSVASYLNQVSAEQRGNANYNPYKDYKLWFYRTYKPVIKPVEKDEFEKLNVAVMEPSTAQH